MAGDYDLTYYTLNTNSLSQTTGNITIGDWYYHNGINCCNGNHYWYTGGYTLPVTKYLYQIFCPKPGCKGKFWGEIDQVVPCPECKSRIKITDKVSDYEVSVT